MVKDLLRRLEEKSSIEDRVKSIIKMAEKETRMKDAKLLLSSDRDGHWSMEVKKALGMVKGEAEQRGISDERTNREVARYVAYKAESAVRRKKIPDIDPVYRRKR